MTTESVLISPAPRDDTAPEARTRLGASCCAADLWPREENGWVCAPAAWSAGCRAQDARRVRHRQPGRRRPASRGGRDGRVVKIVPGVDFYFMFAASHSFNSYFVFTYL